MIGRWLGVMWGLGGVVLVLGYAVYRLAGISVEAFGHPFDWRHWTVLLVNVAFMAHAEGYRGFQKSYSPRVVARAKCLLEEPRAIRIVLSPIFCMGFFASTRRRLVSTYVLTAGIVVLIVAFQQISQPWRGILDVGVVVGLSWGLVSIAVFAVRAFSGADFDHSPEVPGFVPISSQT